VDGSFRYPKETAVGVGVFWGLLALLSVYLMWAYHVERLLMWEDRLRVIGSFCTRDVNFAEITEAKWRVFPAPGGSLVLRTPGGKAVVYFGNYGSVHGPRLKDFFRSALPAELQTGWDAHDEMYTPTPAKEEHTRKTQRWTNSIMGVMGVGLIAFGVINPVNDPASRWISLIIGTLNVAFVGYVVFTARRRAANTPVRPNDTDSPASPRTHP